MNAVWVFSLLVVASADTAVWSAAAAADAAASAAVNDGLGDTDFAVSSNCTAAKEVLKRCISENPTPAPTLVPCGAMEKLKLGECRGSGGCADFLTIKCDNSKDKPSLTHLLCRAECVANPKCQSYDWAEDCVVFNGKKVNRCCLYENKATQTISCDKCPNQVCYKKRTTGCVTTPAPTNTAAPTTAPTTAVPTLKPTQGPPFALSEAGAEAACGYMSGWSVKWKDTSGGSLICTKGGVSSGENCNSCADWRLFVWKNGGRDMSHSGATYRTRAGNYYAGHKPCRGGWNLPHCGTWRAGSAVENDAQDVDLGADSNSAVVSWLERIFQDRI